MKEKTRKKILKRLPDRPGVYLFKGDLEILYVGKAKSLAKRVRSYLTESDEMTGKNRRMVSAAVDLDFIVTDSDLEALILENNFIKQYRPRYNVQLKDDKTYPFIKCTLSERFSRLVLTRRKTENDGNLYFGPFTAGSARATLRFLMKEFRLRPCREKITGSAPRPCLYYDIKRCLGPCVSRLISEDRYRLAVQSAVLFLQGKNKKLIAHLKGEMGKCAREERFEEAAYYRDLLADTERIFQPQKATSTRSIDLDGFGYYRSGGRWSVQVLTVRKGKLVEQDIHHLTDRLEREDASNLSEFIQRYYSGERDIPPGIALPFAPDDRELLSEWLTQLHGKRVNIKVPERGFAFRLVRMADRNATLLWEAEYGEEENEADIAEREKVFGTPSLPSRIECFDLSNIQGSYPVASMISWQDGELRKDQYRKYRIKTVTGPDDFAGMKEVVFRRYRRLLEEKQSLPEVVLVDGGRGQVSAALSALDEIGLSDRIRVIGLAKKEEALYTPDRKAPLLLPETSATLKLLQKLRDEAHRFALAFHRQRRKKETLRTRLLDIPGIGEKRAGRLLRAFGSVEKIKKAAPEEIAAVVGQKTAARLRKAISRPF